MEGVYKVRNGSVDANSMAGSAVGRQIPGRGSMSSVDVSNEVSEERLRRTWVVDGRRKHICGHLSVMLDGKEWRHQMPLFAGQGPEKFLGNVS